MREIIRLIDLQGRAPAQPLMGALPVVVRLVEPKLVAPLLRGGEMQDMEQLLIVGPVGALDEGVLPGLARLVEAVAQPQGLGLLLKGALALGVGGVFHREGHGVVGHDQPKGGEGAQRPLQHAGHGGRVGAGMDLAVFHPGAQVDQRDLVLKARAARHRRKLLDIHLGAVAPHRDRPARPGALGAGLAELGLLEDTPQGAGVGLRKAAAQLPGQAPRAMLGMLAPRLQGRLAVFGGDRTGVAMGGAGAVVGILARDPALDGGDRDMKLAGQLMQAEVLLLKEAAHFLAPRRRQGGVGMQVHGGAPP